MDDVLKKFESLLLQSEQGIGGSLKLLLSQLSEHQTLQIKLCSIPHQFDHKVLSVLLPNLTEQELKETFTELANLSIILVQSDGAELALHDEARQYLFRSWLLNPIPPLFRQANERLVSYFDDEIITAAASVKTPLEFNRMFHLLGVDIEKGFAEFDKLFHQRLIQYHNDECVALIKLVQEYDLLLDSKQKLLITYFRGRLEFNLCNWSEALKLFYSISNDEDTSGFLRVKANQHIGLVYIEMRDWYNAKNIFKQAIEASETVIEKDSLIDALQHDLGVTYFNLGEIEKAESSFRESIKLAEKGSNIKVLACAYNSYGKLYQQIGDSASAIKFYEQSIEYLERINDEFGKAGVYNNLGTTYADIREWIKSEEVLQKSLDMKKSSGDLRGQAKVLCNLTRTYQNMGQHKKAIESAVESLQLFKFIKDFYNAGQVSYNIGKLFKALNAQKEAAAYLQESIRIFEECGENEKARSIQQDLKVSSQSLPWWIWLSLVIVLMLLLLIIFSISSGV